MRQGIHTAARPPLLPVFAVIMQLASCGRSGFYDFDSPSTLTGRCELLSDHFAGSVLVYDPTYGGAPAPGTPEFTDPAAAVGPPDYSFGAGGAVALGQGGRLELSLPGCALARSFDAEPDLRIHEIGDFPERTLVSLRPIAGTADSLPLTDDGWFVVGPTFGALSDIDLDAVLTEADSPQFDAVRIIDDPTEGGWCCGATGADIDAVEILTAVPMVSD